MKNLPLQLTVGLATLTVLLAGAAPVAAVDRCPDGIQGTIISNVCVPSSAGTGLSDTTVPAILVNVANWIVGIFSTVALIVLIFCGIQYLLAAGDGDDAEEAKRCLKWAIIGLFLFGGAFILIRTIAGAFQGAIPRL